jgi:hypothetical protein
MALETVFPNSGLEAFKDKLVGNTVANPAEWQPEEFAAFKAQLDQRGIHIGKIIGAGAFAMVFELLDKDNKPLEKNVLRIETADSGNDLQNPAAIPTLFKFKSSDFDAAIVPKAIKREYSIEDIKPALAAINSQGKLDHLTDLNHDLSELFMEVPGISVPVFVDLNAIKSDEAVAKDAVLKAQGIALKGMGTISHFLDKHKLNESEIRAVQLEPKALQALFEEQRVVVNTAKNELTAAGINMDEVPTLQAHPTLKRAGHQTSRGAAL